MKVIRNRRREAASRLPLRMIFFPPPHGGWGTVTHGLCVQLITPVKVASAAADARISAGALAVTFQ